MNADSIKFSELDPIKPEEPCICAADGCSSADSRCIETIKSRLYKIEGIDCFKCSETVEYSLFRIEGILRVHLNPDNSMLRIDYNYDKNPDALFQAVNLLNKMGFSVNNPAHIKTAFIVVQEMDCPNETKIINKALHPLHGVAELHFDTINRKLKVVYDSKQINITELIDKIKKVGMTPLVKGEEVCEKPISQLTWHFISAAASGILILSAYIADKVIGSPQTAVVLYLLSILAGGCFTVRRAYYSLKNFNADMNLLMTVAVTGALFLGEWLEGSMVVFLFSLAQLLENRSMEKTGAAIRELMKLTPEKALVKTLEEPQLKPSQEVTQGEILIIKPGSRIPLDGTVLEGSSWVNQASVTGESLPVQKKKGDKVFAGTINENGALEVIVTHVLKDSAISRIIRLVEEAKSKKAPAQMFIDRFAKYYTPGVMISAALTAVIPPLMWGADPSIWIYRALVLLMIACPCALVISTPVSVVSGLAKAAKEGILIKGGVYLENLAGIKALALDKTGTLTYGKPSIDKIICLDGRTREYILSAASGVELFSEHPLASAVIEKAKTEGVLPMKTDDFQALPGMGAKAASSGKVFHVGSHRYFDEKKLCTPETHIQISKMEEEGKTVVLTAEDHNPIGLFTISDTLREGVEDTLSRLRQLGLQKIIMLTGDHQKTAAKMASKLNIDYIAQLLPEDKMRAVLELKKKYGKTAMAGDGINDAPALSAADVGIAMGAAGTDAVLETAHVALMGDHIDKLPFAIGLAKASMNIIHQNIVFALGLKSLFLALAVGGYATIWMAVIADTGATLLVILNSMRLLRFKMKDKSR